MVKSLCRSPQVMDSVLDVEKPLVQGQIRDIDVLLKKAEESLKWNSKGQHSLKYKRMPSPSKNGATVHREYISALTFCLVS